MYGGVVLSLGNITVCCFVSDLSILYSLSNICENNFVHYITPLSQLLSPSLKEPLSLSYFLFSLNTELAFHFVFPLNEEVKISSLLQPFKMENFKNYIYMASWYRHFYREHEMLDISVCFLNIKNICAFGNVRNVSHLYV